MNSPLASFSGLSLGAVGLILGELRWIAAQTRTEKNSDKYNPQYNLPVQTLSSRYEKLHRVSVLRDTVSPRRVVRSVGSGPVDHLQFFLFR